TSTGNNLLSGPFDLLEFPMKRRAGITLAGALLAASLWSLTAYSADDDDEKKAIKEAQQAVLKLMDSMNGNNGDVKAQAKAIKDKFEELKPVMWVYKKRSKGGIGMGKDGADDIELKIGKIGSSTSKEKLTPKKLADMKADLIKAGELSKAVAEVGDLYAQQYAKKNPAKWKEYIKDMKKGSDELIEAAKSDNVEKVKKAANNLNSSCTNCHGDFRE